MSTPQHVILLSGWDWWNLTNMTDYLGLKCTRGHRNPLEQNTPMLKKNSKHFSQHHSISYFFLHRGHYRSLHFDSCWPTYSLQGDTNYCQIGPESGSVSTADSSLVDPVGHWRIHSCCWLPCHWLILHALLCGCMGLAHSSGLCLAPVGESWHPQGMYS